MNDWRDLFSSRQLLGHGASVEVYREMLDADQAADRLDDCRRAAYGYLSLALDKFLNYNSRMSVWMPTREVVANTFNRHDFAFCWSHAEMAPLIVGLGYDWAIEQTAKCIGELVALVQPNSAADGRSLLDAAEPRTPTDPPPVTITCKGRIPDFPVTRSHPPASWPSAANSSICRTYRKTAGEESRRRSPVANRWMRP